MTPSTIKESTMTVKTIVVIPLIISLLLAAVSWGSLWGGTSSIIQECHTTTLDNRDRINKIENTISKIDTHLEYIRKSIDEIKDR